MADNILFGNNYFKDSILEEIKINACKERKLYMVEEFDRESCLKIIRRLDKIIDLDIRQNIAPEDSEDINIYIDSYGGCLHSCFGLISVVRKYQKLGYKINTIAMGRAMSAGLYLLLVGTKRYAYELSSLMIHDQRAFEYGYKTVRDKRVELKEWEKEWSRLKDLIFEYSDITDEQIEWYVERALDWNMTTEEAIKLNVIDYLY